MNTATPFGHAGHGLRLKPAPPRRISQAEARYMLSRLEEIEKAYYDGKYERSHVTLIKIGKMASDAVAVGQGKTRGGK